MANPAKKIEKEATSASAKSSGKRTFWNFPKSTLEDAIAIAKAIEEKNAGKPLDSPTLAKYVGFRQSADWRYLDLLRSANSYGLVTGAGAGASVIVSLAPLGEGIVAPSAPSQRKEALAKAFHSVELFKQVADLYEGKRIPEEEYLANTVNRQFNVPRDRVEKFIEVFLSNLEYLKAFAASPRTSTRQEDTDAEVGPDSAPKIGKASEVASGEVREFLDTCFVLMPFGGWHDRYYEDIYRPAIKDAGFEPVRADDLFHTGSVMEQIWEQVRKAGVVLAELTGKNANVFYELGLAHAIGKPVVFVSGTMEDVPFDLRHLRVIPYDIRDPHWGAKLKEGISAYLRNVKKNPTAAIPQPFRTDADERNSTADENDSESDEGDETGPE